MKEHKKLGLKQVSKVTLHFVWGQLSRKQTVGRHSSYDCTVDVVEVLHEVGEHVGHGRSTTLVRLALGKRGAPVRTPLGTTCVVTS